MTARQQRTTYISMSVVVQRTGLSPAQVQRCMARGLVAESLRDADLADLRRIRRLQEMGVNTAGIEIILHMRERIQALQAELDRLEHAAGRPDTFHS